MGAFTSVFGDSPQVAVIEAFAENPDDDLSASDIIYMTDISKRAVYYTLTRLVKEGIIMEVPTDKMPGLFRLNNNDLRSSLLPKLERILLIGKLESEIKEDQDIPQNKPLPTGIQFSDVEDVGHPVKHFCTSEEELVWKMGATNHYDASEKATYGSVKNENHKNSWCVMR